MSQFVLLHAGGLPLLINLEHVTSITAGPEQGSLLYFGEQEDDEVATVDEGFGYLLFLVALAPLPEEVGC